MLWQLHAQALAWIKHVLRPERCVRDETRMKIKKRYRTDWCRAYDCCGALGKESGCMVVVEEQRQKTTVDERPNRDYTKPKYSRQRKSNHVTRCPGKQRVR